MEETNNRKEVTIVPPEGYEIDKENSTLGHIVFKKFETEPYRWRDDKDARINGYYIDSSTILHTTNKLNVRYYYALFATEKQAKSALAMARISQIMENDKRFGGVVTDEEWNDENIVKYTIERFNDYVETNHQYCIKYNFLAFHTFEQCDLFLLENEDLVKQYLMIE